MSAYHLTHEKPKPKILWVGFFFFFLFVAIVQSINKTLIPTAGELHMLMSPDSGMNHVQHQACWPKGNDLTQNLCMTAPLDVAREWLL